MGLPPELERIVAQEVREMGPHQEEIDIVDLGIDSGKREVKIGRGAGTDEEQSLYYKFMNKRHNALTKGKSKP